MAAKYREVRRPDGSVEYRPDMGKVGVFPLDASSDPTAADGVAPPLHPSGAPVAPAEEDASSMPAASGEVSPADSYRARDPIPAPPSDEDEPVVAGLQLPSGGGGGGGGLYCVKVFRCVPKTEETPPGEAPPDSEQQPLLLDWPPDQAPACPCTPFAIIAADGEVVPVAVVADPGLGGTVFSAHIEPIAGPAGEVTGKRVDTAPLPATIPLPVGTGETGPLGVSFPPGGSTMSGGMRKFPLKGGAPAGPMFVPPTRGGAGPGGRGSWSGGPYGGGGASGPVPELGAAGHVATQLQEPDFGAMLMAGDPVESDDAPGGGAMFNRMNPAPQGANQPPGRRPAKGRNAPVPGGGVDQRQNDPQAGGNGGPPRLTPPRLPAAPGAPLIPPQLGKLGKEAPDLLGPYLQQEAQRREAMEEAFGRPGPGSLDERDIEDERLRGAIATIKTSMPEPPPFDPSRLEQKLNKKVPDFAGQAAQIEAERLAGKTPDAGKSLKVSGEVAAKLQASLGGTRTPSGSGPAKDWLARSRELSRIVRAGGETPITQAPPLARVVGATQVPTSQPMSARALHGAAMSGGPDAHPVSPADVLREGREPPLPARFAAPASSGPSDFG